MVSGVLREPLAIHGRSPRDSAQGILAPVDVARFRVVLVGAGRRLWRPVRCDWACSFPVRCVGTLCSSEGVSSVHAKPVGNRRRSDTCECVGWVVGLGFWCVSVFENFIASASIFTASNEEHMVDALAPRADEGRGKLR